MKHRLVFVHAIAWVFGGLLLGLISGMMTGCGNGSSISLSENAPQTALNFITSEDNLESLAETALTLSEAQRARLKVTHYRIKLTRQTEEGLFERVVIFNQNQQQRLESLDPGTNYEIVVEALNSTDEILRAQRLSGIEVIAGVVTPIELRLVARPLFLNVQDGSLLTRGQNSLLIRGETGERLDLSIEALSDLDFGIESRVIRFDAGNGFYQMALTELPPGHLRLSLGDPITQNQVRVHFYSKQPGALGWRFSNAGTMEDLSALGGAFGASAEGAFPELMQVWGGFDE